ncbi:MAG: hypothetical protein HYZ47_02350 [Simkania negevensis]|nr:hypothetical protein [Simkania negevensis]
MSITMRFVRYQIDLPPPSAELPPSYLGTTIASAISHAMSPPMGPVHINCMLREPFFPHEATHPSPSHCAETLFISGKKTLSLKQIQLLSEELSEQKKGVILVSYLPTFSNYESLYTLSKLLGWPIFPTLPSPLRSFGFGNGLIPYYDLILNSNGFNEDFSLDAVLQFGDCYASKKFLSWIEFKKPKLYMQVSADLTPADPNRAITHRVVSDPLDFCDKLSTHLLKKPFSNWLTLWQELGESTEEGLFSFFEKNKMLSEAHIFHHLSSLLKENTPLFLAISMTIREADLFFSPKKKIGTVYANRGVSGIDGNIATSIGLAKALKKPFLSILGDLAFLHDLNSLSQLSSLEHPICFIVFNNGGGGIFSAFSELKKQDSFEKFFQTPHHLELCHVAPLFGLEYIHLTNLEELPKALEKGEKQHSLIEVLTCAEKTYALHDEIFSYLKEIHQSTSTAYSAL